MAEFDVRYWQSDGRWRAELYRTKGWTKGTLIAVGFGDTKEVAFEDGFMKAKHAQRVLKRDGKLVGVGMIGCLVISGIGWLINRKK